MVHCTGIWLIIISILSLHFVSPLVLALKTFGHLLSCYKVRNPCLVATCRAFPTKQSPHAKRALKKIKLSKKHLSTLESSWQYQEMLSLIFFERVRVRLDQSARCIAITWNPLTERHSQRLCLTGR